MATIKDLPLALQKKWRAMCSKGGKNGCHADKVRAGKLGAEARMKKAKESTAQENSEHPLNQ
jgi:hypothetical protein